MATAQDAELILKLYELRRDETMREARKFIALEFFPETIDDLKRLTADPQNNAYVRMVFGYWDMAAALVNHGTIDRQLFYDANAEFFGAWSKVAHFIDDLRQFVGVPQFLANLEKLVAAHPDGHERTAQIRERLKVMATGMSAGQK